MWPSVSHHEQGLDGLCYPSTQTPKAQTPHVGTVSPVGHEGFDWWKSQVSMDPAGWSQQGHRVETG